MSKKGRNPQGTWLNLSEEEIDREYKKIMAQIESSPEELRI